MRTTIILALTSSALAMPFGNIVDAMFGTNVEARHEPHPDHMPSFHPIGKGSGTGFPSHTGTGPFPTASGGHHHHHSHSRHPHKSKTLAIDYTLAPTAAPTSGTLVKRQGGTQSLPSFTLVDPSNAAPGVPTPTGSPDSSPTAQPEDPFPTNTPEPPFPIPSGRPSPPFPTGGFPRPTGGFPFPTGGFPTPTGGFPSRPTTLHTHTRHPHSTHTHRPRPTSSTQPEFPQVPGNKEQSTNGDGQSWADWLAKMFGNRGNGRSEMQN